MTGLPWRRRPAGARIVAAGRELHTDGRVIYAVGDVHGRYDLLVRLLEAIAADAGAFDPEDAPILVFCGDYVDRGPDSARVLACLLWLQRRAPFDCRFLKGNHEQMLLEFLAGVPRAEAWLDHGGLDTLRSYGVAVGDGEPDPAVLRSALLDRMPASHLRFLGELSLILAVGDYAFVHAGIRPGVPLHRQAEDDLMWIREDFLETERAFEKVIVHGHSWTSVDPTVRPHRIGVDTGAHATGVLTAVRLGRGPMGFLRSVAA